MWLFSFAEAEEHNAARDVDRGDFGTLGGADDAALARLNHFRVG